MKIGILTFPNSTSFGATLQMYALFQATKTCGHEVEIINYYNPYMKAEKHIRKPQLNHGVSLQGRLIMQRIVHFRQILAFRRFENKMQLYPPKCICNTDNLKLLENRYDAVICGSDQVWNPRITDGDFGFYLNFCGEGTKRISYAPSFGNIQFSENKKDDIQKELSKFSSVSVREQEGQTFLQKVMGKEYPVVLDPTFLLSEKDWIELERKCSIPKEGYILYYTVRSSAKLLEFCKKIAKEQQKKMIIVGGNIVKKIRNSDDYLDYACDLGPQEWLYLVHHADCVVTNSFHGTAFAMHYKKDFYVEFSSDTNARMEEIIRITELRNRVVDYVTPVSKSPIDYEQVSLKLLQPKQHSLSYLKAAIM